MTVKWNRESLLVTVTLLMLLLAVFYYGDIYIIEPVRSEAEELSQLADEQRSLMAAYPPDDAHLSEYEKTYNETAAFLPAGDDANQAMVILEQSAGQSSVNLVSVSRLSEHQDIEGVDSAYVKNTYEAELTGASPADMRQLIDQLMNQERVWNVTSFTYEKSGENNYSGTLLFELFYYLKVTE